MENNTTWQRIYELAAQIYKIKPWEFLGETDIFGVRSPESGKDYFISIMGSENILPAVAAYEGSQALYRFWMLENIEKAEGSDVLILQHMILSFETEEDIDQDQLKRFRSMNNDPVFTNRFPEVRKVIPGLFPGEPDETSLKELVVVLEQSINVCDRAAADGSFIEPPEEDEELYLVREKHDGEWKDHYNKIEPDIPDYQALANKDDIALVSSLPESQAVMQAHAQLLPFPIRQEGKPVYFPFLILLVNKKSGRVENSTMLLAEPDFDTMLSKVPGLFLDFIKSLGFKPRALEVKSDLMFDMLEESLHTCGIRVLQFKQLPALAEAVEGIVEAARGKK